MGKTVTKARLRHAYYEGFGEAARWVGNRRNLGALDSSPNPRVQAIGRALREAMDGRLTADEAAVIRRIEERRTALESSRQVVSMARRKGSPEQETTRLRQRARQEGATAETGSDVATAVVGEICRRASKSPKWALVLFKLVRHLQPAACLEIGTCLGISAAYQAAALQLNGAGRLVTVEGIESLAALAAANLDELQADAATVVTGMFGDVWEGLAPTLPELDYAFVDGSHNPRSTLRFFEELEAHMEHGGVFVFDDIRWSPGMAAAWTIIQSYPHVAAAIDLIDIGVCVVGPSTTTKTYRVAFGLPFLLDR